MNFTFLFVPQLSFKGHDTGQGKVKVDNVKAKISMKSTSDLVVPCFPLETLLLALNTTYVDFFSLDVEGVELAILKTIDFDQFQIETLAVEYAHGNRSLYRSYMGDKGYRVEKQIDVVDPTNFLFANDYIFVKEKKDYPNKE